MNRVHTHAGENALADGGKVTMHLEDTFWAAKFGMLEDKFGVGWMVSVQHKG
jgi:PhnB protein